MRILIPPIFTALLCFIAFTSCNTTGEPHFHISLERTSDGLSAQCSKGCNWKKVSISTKLDEPVFLDEAGVSSEPVYKSAAKNSFAFSITTTEDNLLQFSSIGGTAWGELSFTLEEGTRQAIDEMGMTE